MMVHYQLSLSIVNVARCDHFILLSLYNLYIFYVVVIIFIK